MTTHVFAEPRAPEIEQADRRPGNGRMRQMYFVWATFFLGAIGVLLVKAADPTVLEGLSATASSFLTWTVLATAAMAFVCEFIDSTLGMGYGTTLTPVLLLLGYEPLQVVPAVLLSELLTGITGGLLHHGAGNVCFHRGSRHLHVMLVLVAASVLGTAPAVYAATQLPAAVLKGFIGTVVLGVGVVLLATLNRTFRFSWNKVAGLGILAAVNKAVSGGGYGPVVVGGQVVVGLETKNAIGITAMAEGATCIVGVVTYAVTLGIDARLALPLVVGAMGSVPLAVISVKAASARRLRIGIGVLTVILGVATLAKMIW